MAVQQNAAQQGENAQQRTIGPIGLSLEQFQGVNTSTTRPGVRDEQCAWIDGFFPIAPGNLRTLYGIGDVLFEATGGNVIVCFYFYNLGSNPYVVIFQSDGSAIQVNTNTAVATTILAAGTITLPNINNLGISQSGSKYLIIVANQANGYFLWDGSLLYTAGTLSPQITITNPGSAYVSAPAVVFSGGSGNGAAAIAHIGGGFVTNITLTNPGSGYRVGDEPTITLVGGQQGGTGANLTAVLGSTGAGSGATFTVGLTQISSGPLTGSFEITSVNVTNGGSNYSSFTTLTVAVLTGSQLTPASLTPNMTGGVITSVTINNTGVFGGTPTGGGGISPPTFSITANDNGLFTVVSVTVNSGGSNYSPSTIITATGGGSPISQASLRPTIVGGVITSVQILNGGVYGSNTPPTLAVTDSVVTATAVCSIMPFGIQGTAVQTYQGRSWVFNGNVFNFTAPGSVTDFSTSNGGGSQQSADSNLRIGYIQAVQTNGFLFVLGDSSMNYISGVQTAGTPPTTTYTYNNSDPEIGTPYPACVTTVGQEILIANSTGIFVSTGGAFQKISMAMDGVYNTVPATNFNSNPFSGFQLSAAKATIFGKRVWMVLVPIVNPVLNTVVNQLLMFSGDQKIWFSSQQDSAGSNLTFIQGQEINSVYTAWGTNGTFLFPLFNRPVDTLAKIVESKFWFDPGGYESYKSTNRFWSVWQCYDTTTTQIDVGIDGIGIDGNGNQFATAAQYTITGPTSTGFFTTPPQAIGQQGIAIGMRIATLAKDMALISAKIDSQEQGYRG